MIQQVIVEKVGDCRQKFSEPKFRSEEGGVTRWWGFSGVITADEAPRWAQCNVYAVPCAAVPCTPPTPRVAQVRTLASHSLQ